MAEATNKLPDHEFIEQTCTLTQCILNVMVLETNGKRTSVAVFATTLGHILGIVAKAVVEQSGGDIEAYMREVIKVAKDVMKEEGVISDYMREALSAYEGYKAVMQQVTETKGSMH